jgi:hypothetical protein
VAAFYTLHSMTEWTLFARLMTDRDSWVHDSAHASRYKLWINNGGEKMLTYIEYCSHCRGFRTMTRSVGILRGSDPNSEDGDVLLMHFHCATCQSYVCSSPLKDEENLPRIENQSPVGYAYVD